ncbi:MAG: vWA domain-containing protein [Bacteroidota bacterium]
MEKKKVYNLIILDESGSMQSIKNMIISGLNEVVQTIKGVAEQFPEQEHFVSFYSFNALGTKTHLSLKPAKELHELDGKNYRPTSGTPLFDAMGFSINQLRDQIKAEENSNVLVTILTDGMENASKEYDRKAIKALIEELEEENWTFTYIGTDHNVEDFAVSISIKNTLRFKKDSAGLREMFAKEGRSRRAYSRKLRENKSTKEDYFSDEA